MWGTVTTTSYNILSQTTSTTSTPVGHPGSTEQFTYDNDGHPTQIAQGDGQPLANVTYVNGELASVAYPAGAGSGATGAFPQDAAGAASGSAGRSLAHKAPTTNRSYAPNRVESSPTRQPTGSDASSYTYTTLGSLYTATIPHHTITYNFVGTTGCGSNPKAGKNGDRTSMIDVLDGVQAGSWAYCYDSADRLTSTKAVNPPTDANGVTSVALSASTIVYDSQGNTTTLGDQTMSDDQTGRHATTSDANGTAITYTRDVTGRVVARSSVVNGGPSTTVRYSFSGGGDAADWTLASDGTISEHTLSLPGGVTVSARPNGSAMWSYPNLNGDVVIVSDQAGARQGGVHL